MYTLPIELSFLSEENWGYRESLVCLGWGVVSHFISISLWPEVLNLCTVDVPVPLLGCCVNALGMKPLLYNVMFYLNSIIALYQVFPRFFQCCILRRSLGCSCIISPPLHPLAYILMRTHVLSMAWHTHNSLHARWQCHTYTVLFSKSSMIYIIIAWTLGHRHTTASKMCLITSPDRPGCPIFPYAAFSLINQERP